MSLSLQVGLLVALVAICEPASGRDHSLRGSAQTQASANVTIDANDDNNLMWIFGVGTDYRIYKQKLEVGLSTTTDWLDAGMGDMISIAINVAQHSIYGVGKDNQIYKQSLSTMSGTSQWELVGKGDMVSIAFDWRFNTIYGVGTDNQIYRQFLSIMSPTSPWAWIPAPTGSSRSIAIDYERDLIYAVGEDNQIYSQLLNGDFTYGWTQVGKGEMVSITIVPGTPLHHAHRIYGVGKDQKVYWQKMDDMTQTSDWIELAKGDMISVACGRVLYPDEDV